MRMERKARRWVWERHSSILNTYSTHSLSAGLTKKAFSRSFSYLISCLTFQNRTPGHQPAGRHEAGRHEAGRQAGRGRQEAGLVRVDSA